MIKESNTKMEEQESVAVPQPNTHTYNLVMESFLQLGDPGRVQDLMLEMDASDFVSPNSESYSKVIRAWLHDEMNNQQKHVTLPGLSCENAWAWLKELLQKEKEGIHNLGPAPDLYASILKTAARTKSSGDNILTVGQAVFWVSQRFVVYISNSSIYKSVSAYYLNDLKAMRESRFGINALAYEWLLEIGLKVLCTPQNHKRREAFVKSLLEQCCKDGLLSTKFASMIRSLEKEERSATEEGEEEIFNKYLQNPPFPATWNRNITDNNKVLKH